VGSLGNKKEMLTGSTSIQIFKMIVVGVGGRDLRVLDQKFRGRGRRPVPLWLATAKTSMDISGDKGNCFYGKV